METMDETVCIWMKVIEDAKSINCFVDKVLLKPKLYRLQSRPNNREERKLIELNG